MRRWARRASAAAASRSAPSGWKSRWRARQRIQVLPGVPAPRSFDPLRIPPGQYLMLGDNRNDSADSRVIGLVPREKLVGRAERILVSAAYQENWMPRLDRFGMSLREDR
ncbi:signal peptidase I [Massilia timonae CCUG 45783]|uniref:Signal peptidase I n=2 Tax=Telluria group TaxID=2895353 RepID=K9DSK2_9BURK|nr:signal peptidase I [Massilia timonae CCUG 45783]